MTQNPFEAPRVGDAPNPQAGTGTFDIGKCVNDGWTAVTQNLGVVIGTLLVGMLAAVAAELTVIGLFVVVPVLAWGGVRFVLNLLDGRAQFDDLFSGFKQYGNALGSMLLLSLISIVPLIPGYALAFAGGMSRSMALAGIGELAIVVVMFTVMIRLYFAAFFVVDQGMGAMDAVKASWAATGHQKLMTLALVIVS